MTRTARGSARGLISHAAHFKGDCSAGLARRGAPRRAVLRTIAWPLITGTKSVPRSVLVVVGVNHRDAILDVALAVLAAPGNLLTRITGDDDDDGRGRAAARAARRRRGYEADAGARSGTLRT